MQLAEGSLRASRTALIQGVKDACRHISKLDSLVASG